MKLNLQKLKEDYNLLNLGNIDKVASLNNPKNNSLMFILEYTEKEEIKLKDIKNSLLIVNEEANISKDIQNQNSIIYIDNPRREYIYILNKYNVEKKKNYSKELSYISKNVVIGENTIIEPFVFIDENVIIGNNCYIKSGVKIYKNVTIGNNCTIGANTVVGDIGFGIERIAPGKRQKISFEGIPMKMPHYGGVIIGDNVEIGALNTIVSGAIDPTIIKDFVKTDDHVHIGHNVYLEEGVLLTAAVEISGSVKIGKNTWIGPNSSLMQKIKVGENTIIGIGTNVLKSSAENEILMGNPAKSLRRK